MDKNNQAGTVLNRTTHIDLERCRICLIKGIKLISLYEKAIVSRETMYIAEILSKCCNVKISVDDRKPQKICRKCAEIAKSLIRFKRMCEQSDEKLNDELLFDLITENCIIKDEEVNNIQNKKELNQDILDVRINEGSKQDLNITHEEVIIKDEQIDIQDEYETNPSDNMFPQNKLSKVVVDLQINYINEVENDIIEIQNDETFNSQEADSEDEAETVQDPNLIFPDEKAKEKVKIICASDDSSCDICGWIFKTNEEMLNHKQKQHKSLKKCSYCIFTSKTSKEMTKHKIELHADKKKFICPTCSKSFFRRTQLTLHLLTHTGEKKHICETCGMAFTLSGNLKTHQRIHNNEFPYECKECGKKFNQTSSLRLHLVGHYNVRSFICSTCGEGFTRLSGLRHHQRTHNNSRPYKCEICDKSFKTSSTRKYHQATHTNIRNKTCEVCNKKFLKNTQLKTHMRTHTGEKPYVCEFCAKGFSQAVCLRSHVKVHHKTVEPKENE